MKSRRPDKEVPEWSAGSSTQPHPTHHRDRAHHPQAAPKLLRIQLIQQLLHRGPRVYAAEAVLIQPRTRYKEQSSSVGGLSVQCPHGSSMAQGQQGFGGGGGKGGHGCAGDRSQRQADGRVPGPWKRACKLMALGSGCYTEFLNSAVRGSFGVGKSTVLTDWIRLQGMAS